MRLSAITRQFHALSVLQYKGFRLFWSGLMLQIAGHTMMQVTVGWLAFNLTGSALDLGYVTLALAVPSVSLTAVGGVFADRWDPRRIIAIIQAVAAVMVTTLAVLSITDRMELWHLIVGAFVTGSVIAFDQPSQQALFPRLLPDRRQLANAVPLIGVAWDFNRIISPAIAGFLIHAGGAGTSFLVSVAGFSAMVVMVQLVRPRKAERIHAGNVFQNLREGVSYIRRHQTFRILVSLAYLNSFLGMSYIPLLPIFAVDVLHVDARGLGFLASAGGVGAIAGGLFAPRMLGRFRAGRLLTVGTLLFGAALTGFAFSTSFPLSMALIAVEAAASTLVFVVIEIVLQMLVPDQLRGRVMGIMTIVWSMPALGAAVIAPIANFTSPSIALGGAAVLMTLNVLAIRIFSPALRNLGALQPIKPQSVEITGTDS